MRKQRREKAQEWGMISMSGMKKREQWRCGKQVVRLGSIKKERLHALGNVPFGFTRKLNRKAVSCPKCS